MRTILIALTVLLLVVPAFATQFEAPGFVRELAIRGTTVYALSSAQDAVWKFDLSGTLLATLEVTPGTEYIAAGPEGELYAGMTSPEHILDYTVIVQRVAADGVSRSEWTADDPDRLPFRDIEAAPDGSVYVMWKSYTSRYDGSTGLERPANFGGPGLNKFDISVSGAGSFYEIGYVGHGTVYLSKSDHDGSPAWEYTFPFDPDDVDETSIYSAGFVSADPDGDDFWLVYGTPTPWDTRDNGHSYERWNGDRWVSRILEQHPVSDPYGPHIAAGPNGTLYVSIGSTVYVYSADDATSSRRVSLGALKALYAR